MQISRIATLIALMSLTRLISAQTPVSNAIDSASLTLVNPAYLDVHLTAALANPSTDLTLGNVTVTSTPALHPNTINLLPGSRKALRITFSDDPVPAVTQAKICFGTLTFGGANGGEDSNNVCSLAVEILDPARAAAARDRVLKELQQVPKTADEKNVFASGFVTTASSGTQGGLDLSLNSNDLGIPGMTAFLHTQKASTPGGDPKNFEVGTNFRNTYTFGGGHFTEMRTAIETLRHSVDPAAIKSATATINDAQSAIQRGLLSGIIVDFAGRLEGGATDFNVVNYVGNGSVSLQSRTKTLFGSRHGFWQFRLQPVGIEGGRNIQNVNTSTTSTTSTVTSTKSDDFLARYAGGGTFTLFYDNAESILPFKRLQIDLATVHRYLFFKESEIISPKATPVLADGYRPWYQADVKVYLAEAPSGRYGARISYNSGSLPPEFAHARSFQFGFVYETADDTKK